ncbi:MAG: hypothetical protein HYU53_18680 [Acidobacteria bacterium]|nr:hypothetical protein [Acidobacteriota bacterium]
MSVVSWKTDAEREEICREIDARLAALPETNDKGKLRGLVLRLRDARRDARRFQDEFEKLAALSETIAREGAVVRLHELATTRWAGSALARLRTVE